jgi:hypothetical protein
LATSECRLRGVLTRADGGVDIVTPVAQCVAFLRSGGAISNVVLHREGFESWLLGVWGLPYKTYLSWCKTGAPMNVALGFEAWKFYADPRWRSDLAFARRQSLAMQWVCALHRGGLTERQAVDLICEISRAPHTAALEIVDVSEIPTGRTRRNEWRRSTNGGPIIVPDEEISA